MENHLLEIFIFIAICYPAIGAVVGAIWYSSLQTRQFRELQALDQQEKAGENDEDEVFPAPQKAADRRPRRVLLISSDDLGTQDKLWRIQYAYDIEHALEQLKVSRFDLIAMPLSEEAGQFLRFVAQRYPSTCRAVQCQDIGPSEAFQTAPDAHLYLRSDSPPATIQEQLLRGTSLDIENIEKALSNTFGNLATLPTLPTTFARIQQVVSDPDCSVEKVGELIASDISVASKVLQLVNSAIVNTRTPVCKVEHAVKLIGLRGIRDLILSIEVLNELATKAPHLRSYLADMQLRSVRAAKLAQRILGGGPHSDDATSACLLHSIGQITLMTHVPESYQQIQTLHEQTGRNIEELEMEILGVTHDDISAYLLRLWGMPHAVVEAVQFWKNPAEIKHFQFNSMDATHVALNLVIGFETGDIRKAQIDHDLIYALHRSRSVDKWQIQAATICEDISALPTGMLDREVA